MRRKVNRSMLKIDYKEHKEEERWTEPITSTDDGLWEVDRAYDDLMVIISRIRNFLVERIMIDQGSSAHILYKKCFDQLMIPMEELEEHLGNLTGFTRAQVPALGKVRL